MQLSTGTVIAGKVVMNDHLLADGTDVFIISRETEPASLLPDELAEIEAGIQEADAGDTISGDALFARLRRYGP
jgi:hypothetical protein